MEIFIGVDLGTSLIRKSTGVACLVEKEGRPNLENPPLHMISYDDQIHAAITGMCEHYNSRCIAIDAPLSRPEHGNMRECEKQLRKRRIPCYPAGAQWVRDWVNKAIELKQWAQHELGANVIEVYPYAARVTLGIGPHVKKKTKQGRQIIQDGLMTLIDGLDEFTADDPLSDDELDAVLSAYTAYCARHDSILKMHGNDGTILIPKKQRDRGIDGYR